MKKIVDFKLQFRGINILAAELIFQFNQFVLEFYSQLSLIVEIVFIFLLCFLELLSLVLEHKLEFSIIVIIVGWIVYIYVRITSIGVSEAFGNVAVAEFGVNVLVVAGVIGISIVHFKILNYYFYRRV
jgi:hypothetical protein